jgi:hypothetical protein
MVYAENSASRPKAEARGAAKRPKAMSHSFRVSSFERTNKASSCGLRAQFSRFGQLLIDELSVGSLFSWRSNDDS